MVHQSSRRLLSECGYAFLDIIAGCFVLALIFLFLPSVCRSRLKGGGRT